MVKNKYLMTIFSASNVQMAAFILSSESGSILDKWENFQFSEDLTANDVRCLREGCTPQDPDAENLCRC
jgi:hypothetical protein